MKWAACTIITNAAPPKNAIQTHGQKSEISPSRVVIRGCVNFRPLRIPTFLMTGRSHLAPSFGRVVRVYL